MKHFFSMFVKFILSTKKENLAFIIILFASIIFVYPAVFNSGLWASFDSPFHITMIAQFHEALKHFYIPVVWTDGVANYGLPFGIIAHPLTSYIGGLLTFITHEPLQSYKILWLFFSFLSTWGVYRLIRKFTSIEASLVGGIFYTFSAYRILNLYIRGALPEFAAASWLPFLVYSLLSEKGKKNTMHSLLILTSWYTLIFFTHPMFIIFSSVLTSFFLISYHPPRHYWFIVIISVLLALSINAFYLIPLNIEMKYFYLGQNDNFLVKGSSLRADNFLIEKWEYTCSDGDTPLLRCNRIQTGLPEVIILLFSPVLYYLNINKVKKKIYLYLMITAAFTTLLISSLSESIYARINILGSIQYIYRLLNIWILVPPFILSLILDSFFKYKKFTISFCIIMILLLRLPQIYVKNISNPNKAFFYHNIDNIHSVMMNTIWMGEPRNYEKQPEKIQIIEGQGYIFDKKTSPTKHIFNIQAEKSLRIADYTFFFPGWHAFVNDKEVQIQWQDPNHRGYITFDIPGGFHKVEIIFSDTKIRFIGKIISAFAVLVYFIIFMKHKNLMFS